MQKASYGRPVTGALSQQCAHSCIPSCAGFLAKHQITQMTQPPYGPDLVPCDVWLSPKTIITFEREEISDCQWNSGKYDEAAAGDWENCVRSQGAYFEGDWGITVLCTVFLVSCTFFNKCLYFSCYMAAYLLDRPRIYSRPKSRWQKQRITENI